MIISDSIADGTYPDIPYSLTGDVKQQAVPDLLPWENKTYPLVIRNRALEGGVPDTAWETNAGGIRERHFRFSQFWTRGNAKFIGNTAEWLEERGTTLSQTKQYFEDYEQYIPSYTTASNSNVYQELWVTATMQTVDDGATLPTAENPSSEYFAKALIVGEMKCSSYQNDDINPQKGVSVTLKSRVRSVEGTSTINIDYSTTPPTFLGYTPSGGEPSAWEPIFETFTFTERENPWSEVNRITENQGTPEEYTWCPVFGYTYPYGRFKPDGTDAQKGVFGSAYNWFKTEYSGRVWLRDFFGLEAWYWSIIIVKDWEYEPWATFSVNNPNKQ